jgi:hypothetical protein
MTRTLTKGRRSARKPWRARLRRQPPPGVWKALGNRRGRPVAVRARADHQGDWLAGCQAAACRPVDQIGRSEQVIGRERTGRGSPSTIHTLGWYRGQGRALAPAREQAIDDLLAGNASPGCARPRAWPARRTTRPGWRPRARRRLSRGPVVPEHQGHPGRPDLAR